eukprot:3745218-Rhodomonas_salina.1
MIKISCGILFGSVLLLLSAINSSGSVAPDHWNYRSTLAFSPSLSLRGSPVLRSHGVASACMQRAMMLRTPLLSTQGITSTRQSRQTLSFVGTNALVGFCNIVGLRLSCCQAPTPLHSRRLHADNMSRNESNRSLRGLDTHVRTYRHARAHTHLHQAGERVTNPYGLAGAGRRLRGNTLVMMSGGADDLQAKIAAAVCTPPSPVCTATFTSLLKTFQSLPPSLCQQRGAVCDVLCCGVGAGGGAGGRGGLL